MTVEIGLLFAVLAVMVYLFLTEKIPVDLTAFLGLVFLIFAGYVEPGEAFQGFASSAVITMLSIFIVSAAVLPVDAADPGSFRSRADGPAPPALRRAVLRFRHLRGNKKSGRARPDSSTESPGRGDG